MQQDNASCGPCQTVCGRSARDYQARECAYLSPTFKGSVNTMLVRARNEMGTLNDHGHTIIVCRLQISEIPDRQDCSKLLVLLLLGKPQTFDNRSLDHGCFKFKALPIHASEASRRTYLQ